MDEKGSISNINNNIVDKNRTTNVNISTPNSLINTPDNSIQEFNEDINDLCEDIELEWDDETPHGRISKDLAVMSYVRHRSKKS